MSGTERGWSLLFGAWLLATAASLGSLFFSEVMDLPPCSLCWYQRIFMYPLVIVLGMGFFPFDRGVVRYGLPLAIGGWLVAAWHTLLYVGVIPESAAPCAQGVSCAEQTWALFGVFSIPVLSLISFTLLVGLLGLLRRSS